MSDLASSLRSTSEDSLNEFMSCRSALAEDSVHPSRYCANMACISHHSDSARPLARSPGFRIFKFVSELAPTSRTNISCPQVCT